MALDQENEGIIFRIAKWLFLIFVFSLPLVRPFNFRYNGIQIPISDLIFLAAFIIWVVSLLARQAKFRFHRLYYFLGAFGFAMTLSATFSTDPSRSLIKIFGVYYLIAIAVMTINLAADLRFVRQVTLAWLAATAITTLVAIIGVMLFYTDYDTTATNYFLSHYGSLPAGNYPRIRALFENANMMCNYLNVSLVLALAAGRMGWIGTRLSFVIAIATIGTAMLTISAGLGGVFICVGLWAAYVVFNQTRFWSRSLLAASAVIAILAFASTLISPDTRNTEADVLLPGLEKKIEPSVRVLIWQNVLERGAANPLLGSGTGTDTARVEYVAVSGNRQQLRDAHNSWLNIFGQAGLAGLAAFAALCWYLVSLCRFDATRSTKPNYLLVAFSAAFFGAFLFQGLFGSFEDARHLWVLIGLLAAAASFNETVFEPASKPL